MDYDGSLSARLAAETLVMKKGKPVSKLPQGSFFKAYIEFRTYLRPPNLPEELLLPVVFAGEAFF